VGQLWCTTAPTRPRAGPPGRAGGWRSVAGLPLFDAAEEHAQAAVATEGAYLDAAQATLAERSTLLATTSSSRSANRRILGNQNGIP